MGFVFFTVLIIVVTIVVLGNLKNENVVEFQIVGLVFDLVLKTHRRTNHVLQSSWPACVERAVECICFCAVVCVHICSNGIPPIAIFATTLNSRPITRVPGSSSHIIAKRSMNQVF